MPKIADMTGVKNHGNDDVGEVELWRDDENGRLVIRAYNEGGFCSTNVDLWQLLDWLHGPGRALAGYEAVPTPVQKPDTPSGPKALA